MLWSGPPWRRKDAGRKRGDVIKFSSNNGAAGCKSRCVWHSGGILKEEVPEWAGRVLHPIKGNCCGAKNEDFKGKEDNP